MTHSGYLFLGLTASVAALAATLAFAVLKVFAAARTTARTSALERTETAFMAAAMQDALTTLRSQGRAMEARAQASERLSSEIVANLTSGLLVVDGDGTVRTMNPAGRRLLGLGETGPGRSYRELLADAIPLADVIEECLASSRPIVRRALEMAPSTGRASHLGVSVSPIHDEPDRSRGAVCLFTDLSQVVDLEEQLRLKDSLARLGELTAGIAHEFRNGLATIHGYARLVELDRLPAEFRPYIQGIRDETDAMGQVMTKFLNFARPTELVLASVEIGAVARRAADEIGAELSAHGGTIDVRGEFGLVDGDELLLRQAFQNLCRNALEACVHPPAAHVPSIVVEGTMETNPGLQRVTVSDNGPGIEPAIVDRVFRPFVTTKAHGAGLGLALVQKIVVMHNGRVTAASDPTGARFVVTLPLRGAGKDRTLY
jgi:PAS domain S-box-containing protein